MKIRVNSRKEEEKKIKKREEGEKFGVEKNDEE